MNPFEPIPVANPTVLQQRQARLKQDSATLDRLKSEIEAGWKLFNTGQLSTERAMALRQKTDAFAAAVKVNEQNRQLYEQGRVAFRNQSAPAGMKPMAPLDVAPKPEEQAALAAIKAWEGRPAFAKGATYRPAESGPVRDLQSAKDMAIAKMLAVPPSGGAGPEPPEVLMRNEKAALEVEWAKAKKSLLPPKALAALQARTHAYEANRKTFAAREREYAPLAAAVKDFRNRYLIVDPKTKDVTGIRPIHSGMFYPEEIQRKTPSVLTEFLGRIGDIGALGITARSLVNPAAGSSAALGRLNSARAALMYSGAYPAPEPLPANVKGAARERLINESAALREKLMGRALGQKELAHLEPWELKGYQQRAGAVKAALAHPERLGTGERAQLQQESASIAEKLGLQSGQLLLPNEVASLTPWQRKVLPRMLEQVKAENMARKAVKLDEAG
ncbi:MAG TPA: hypothetical protein VGQ73_04805, partial [Gemmatimonadales bacterium]|nr:hypothetical protein [Gemmatimonadales bacterium]